MNVIDAMKNYAAIIRASELLAPLGRQQSLEIAVSLLSPAPSWRHFAAQPSTLVIPQTLEDYFAAVTRAQRCIAALEIYPALRRSERSSFAVEFLAKLAAKPESSSHLSQLLDFAGIEKISMTDRKGLPIPQITDPLDCHLRLALWFFSKLRGGDNPWDHTERLAVAMGFTPHEAAMIRSLQREAPRHAWDLCWWFEVGVLDPDQESFLRELKGEPDWLPRFRNLYASDRARWHESSTPVVARLQKLR